MQCFSSGIVYSIYRYAVILAKPVGTNHALLASLTFSLQAGISVLRDCEVIRGITGFKI